MDVSPVTLWKALFYIKFSQSKLNHSYCPVGDSFSQTSLQYYKTLIIHCDCIKAF